MEDGAELKQLIHMAFNQFQMEGCSESGGAGADLLKLAFQDPLTGLSNQNALLPVMERMLAEGRAWTVAVVDVDRFKYINDACGHGAGDDLLRKIGQGLQEQIGPEEFCARLFSDQFALLLRCTAAEEAEARVRELLAAVNTRQMQNGISVNLSAGIAIYQPERGHVDPNGLITDAQVAAKAVKSVYASEKVAVYDSAFVRRHKRQKVLELQMDNAFRGKEFRFYLQPQVHLENGALMGAECLARWQSKELGLVMPEEFIPLMESNGAAVELDFFMLESACRLLGKWRRQGLRIPLAVNQSRVHFFHPEYLTRVEDTLDRHGVEPGELVFELTETSFYQNEGKIQQVSRTLHAMGIQLAIDDFGTGYSSLSLLNNIDVDIIKLDKTFLDCFFSGSQRNRTIFRKTVELARELGISIVFEGVEEEGQREQLRELNCRFAQGYLFARPMELAEFEEKYGILHEPAAPAYSL